LAVPEIALSWKAVNLRMMVRKVRENAKSSHLLNVQTARHSLHNDEYSQRLASAVNVQRPV
jgi:hypothetical protein